MVTRTSPHVVIKAASSSHHQLQQQQDCLELERLLQESLPHIRQNAFHPVLRTALQALTSYIVGHDDDQIKNKSASQHSTSTSISAARNNSQPLPPMTPRQQASAKLPSAALDFHPTKDATKQAQGEDYTTQPNPATATKPPTATSSATKTTTPTASNKNSHHTNINANLSQPKLRLEQEKKLAAERRRKDLELQRKLARSEQKRKDLLAKRQALSLDQRKQELILQQQKQQIQRPAALVMDPAVTLQQIQQQMTAVNQDISRIQDGIAQIKAEMKQHKQQQQLVAAQQSAVTNSNSTNVSARTKQHHRTTSETSTASASNAQERLEEQKRAAAEKRRLELEQQRQQAREEIKRKELAKRQAFLEQERRKEQLVEQAKVQKGGLDDLDILQKLNVHVNQFDAEEEAKKEDGDKGGDGASVPRAAPSTERETDFDHTTSPESAKEQGSYAQQHPFPFPSSTHSNVPPASEQNSSIPSFAKQESASSPNAPQSSTDSSAQHHQHHPPSGSDQKYMKMATEAQPDGDDPSLHTELKRNILLHWALQPPHMQFLRPIHELLCTVQMVYPPAHGVEAHEYFDGWQAIGPNDGIQRDEKKLSKAVRKLRFFLHPDKRPHSFNDKQHFVCKLLWDVTNDAWEDHKKAQEELDWIH